MARGTWVYDPDSGGVTIPKRLRPTIEARIEKYAEENLAGHYTRMSVRFRSKFCYIDAYIEPAPLPDTFSEATWGETREEHIERMRNTPTHLCRLRYFGDIERWSFAMYGYSNNEYDLTFLPSTGDFFGTLEQCVKVAAGFYLLGEVSF